MIALVVAGIWLLPRVAPSKEARERGFLVDPVHVDVLAAPSWFGGTIEQSLRESLVELAPVALQEDDDVLELADAVARASGGRGWFRAIERVEKRYPNRLQIELSLRRPVALAESDAGMVLLDDEGVVVAPVAEAASFLAEESPPLLHGPRPLRVAAPGERVRERWLDEALRVAAELGPHRSTLEERDLSIAVIDVTAQDRAGGRGLTDVELYTRGGLVIEWGRASTNPRVGALEPAADAKIRGLLRVAARYPRLAGIARVRLQFADPYVVESDETPLAQGAPGAFAQPDVGFKSRGLRPAGSAR